MITNWVKNILHTMKSGAREGVHADSHESANLAGNLIGQGAQAFEKKSRAKLIDVAEGVSFAEQARRQSLLLKSKTVPTGVPSTLNMKSQIRRRVRGNLADFFDVPEVVDEVTEKLENDPYFRSKFK